MKRKTKTVISIIFYILILCAGIIVIPRFFKGTPAKEEVYEIVYDNINLTAPVYTSSPGTDVETNKYVAIDFSNTSQGYISIMYNGDSTENAIAKIIHGETEFIYTLSGDKDVFPLNRGDGTYTVKVYQRLNSGQYKSVLTKKLSVNLENQLLPYLHPSQIVNYKADSLAVVYAERTCVEINSDLEKLQVLYAYVVENITYDHIKATNVESGYLSSVDSTYISKTGICYDYSVLLASMLRSQCIPTKLVMGYLNGTTIFHAWNEIYLADSGWVTVNIFLDKNVFKMLDTTLSVSQGDEEISKKLGDPEVYMPTHRY